MSANERQQPGIEELRAAQERIGRDLGATSVLGMIGSIYKTVANHQKPHEEENPDVSTN